MTFTGLSVPLASHMEESTSTIRYPVYRQTEINLISIVCSCYLGASDPGKKWHQDRISWLL